jgi:glycosyltransferase involved in cell wall biosynthesis
MTELALSLKRLGHDPVICVHDHDPEGSFMGADDQIEIRSVRKGPYKIPVGARNALRQIWREMPELAKIVPSDVEVINAHEFPAIHAGRKAAKRLNTPLVWTRNDYTVFEFALIPGETPVAPMSIAARIPRAIVSLPDALAARAADAIVVLDTRNKRMVRQAYRRNAEIVRSGPAEYFFSPPSKQEARELLGIPLHAFVAQGVGIMLPHRRFEDLIRAISLLPAESGVIARIAGSDHIDPVYATSLRQLIDELDVGDRVTLVNRSVSENELLDSYAAADVFVFPNSIQTWGLAPLEAIAAGSPAIVSRGAGVHEVLEGRPGVQIVDPLKPDQLASALAAVAQRPEDFDAADTRKWIRSELNNDRYGESMLELFRRFV